MSEINNLDKYIGFAEVYDSFMDDIPYDEWCDFVCDILKEYNVTSGKIAELGSGTGTLTCKFRDKGYEMIGIDISQPMIEIATRKDTNNIIYKKMDMREFSLEEKVPAIVSLCDSMNYLLEDEDLLNTFKRVKENLQENGIFVFDMKTRYMYEELMGINAFVDNREDKYLGWENYYDEDEETNMYRINIFEKEADGRYTRYEEEHYQRCYSPELVIQLLEDAGLTFERIYCDLSDDNSDFYDETQRYHFVACNKD